MRQIQPTKITAMLAVTLTAGALAVAQPTQAHSGLADAMQSPKQGHSEKVQRQSNRLTDQLQLQLVGKPSHCTTHTIALGYRAEVGDDVEIFHEEEWDTTDRMAAAGPPLPTHNAPAHLRSEHDHGQLTIHMRNDCADHERAGRHIVLRRHPGTADKESAVWRRRDTDEISNSLREALERIQDELGSEFEARLRSTMREALSLRGLRPERARRNRDATIPTPWPDGLDRLLDEIPQRHERNMRPDQGWLRPQRHQQRHERNRADEMQPTPPAAAPMHE